MAVALIISSLLFISVVSKYTTMWFALASYAVLAAIAYYFSLKLHPNRNCPVCKGRARHAGALFTWGHRPCIRCAGTGRQVRLGYRLFFRDGKKAYQAEKEASRRAKDALRKRT